MSTKRILMVGHGGFGNRGCEAIVTCTNRMIRDIIPDARISVASCYYKADKPLGDEINVNIVPDAPFPLSMITGFAKQLIYRFVPLHTVRSSYKQELYKTQDLILSVGGDNFTSSTLRRIRQFILDLKLAKAMNKKTILWGQNFESLIHAEINDCLLPILADLDLIYVRDHDSLQFLAEKCITTNVVFAPDPAFCLSAYPSERIQPYMEWASSRPTLGVSASGFDLQGEKIGCRIHIFAESLRDWIDQSGYRVLFIPHVVLDHRIGTNDYRFSTYVAKKINRMASVRVMSGNLRASEYKAAIGQCNLFAGSRMHSTIAALSQAVPTLSLSYSHKSISLNKLLFGHTRYVFNMKNGTSQDLFQKIAQLESDKSTISILLKSRLQQLEKGFAKLTDRLTKLLLT